ncbi:hypothetical protein [Marinobacter sp.]|uniref:hypothetical protein n=1 Tax=Marinobacter sp. TaxID=50741 RepID=UPI00356977B9
MAKPIPPFELIEQDALPNSERRGLLHLNELKFSVLQVYFSLPLMREKNAATFRSEAGFILFHSAQGILTWATKGG